MSSMTGITSCHSYCRTSLTRRIANANDASASERALPVCLPIDRGNGRFAKNPPRKRNQS
eukprot:560420-Prorocentrum_lima.AAC.1